MKKNKQLIQNNAVMILLSALISFAPACFNGKSQATGNAATKTETTRISENKDAIQTSTSDSLSNGRPVSEKNTNAKTRNQSVTDEETPETVVAALYQAGKTKDVAEMSKSELGKFFSTPIVDGILNARNGENGLNFDILYESQDTQISNFRIGKAVIKSEGTDIYATVPVTFNNFGEKKQIDYRLGKGVGGNWRILDVIYHADGKSFTLEEILEGDI